MILLKYNHKNYLKNRNCYNKHKIYFILKIITFQTFYIILHY